MKQLLIVLSIFVFSTSSYGQVESVTLQASGLTCSMCSRAIYQSILKVPAVAKVKEDIEHSSYTIELKDPQKVSLDALKKAVQDAGFSVARMELTVRFNHVSVQGNSPFSFGGSSFILVSPGLKELNGEERLVLVDKGFLPEKERRSYGGLTENSVASSAAAAGSRVYHVIVLQS